MGPDIASLTAYRDDLEEQQRSYRAMGEQLQDRLDRSEQDVAALQERLDVLEPQQARLSASLAAAKQLQDEQRALVGQLARLLYRQPSPELQALAQLLEGEDLRAFERRDLVIDVLEAKNVELDETIARVEQLTEDVQAARRAIATTEREIRSATAERDRSSRGVSRVGSALAAIDRDLAAAQEAIDELRRAEEERIREAVAAAAAAEARAAAEAEAGTGTGAPNVPGGPPAGSDPVPQPRAATPSGSGAPARGGDSFSAKLPASVPYRDAFLTYGLRYRVEPALLAAIAYQESGFNAWAGCSRSGAGKGIMQHENASQYCGPAAVPASVEKSARMLADYYNRSGSWTAAIFAYNNGPGLMDEWVRYSADPPRLMDVLARYYNASPWASGPRAGYATWGEWRAAVAYSYAAPTPLPGFRSATEKWLIYRQG